LRARCLVTFDEPLGSSTSGTSFANSVTDTWHETIEERTVPARNAEGSLNKRLFWRVVVMIAPELK